MTGGGEEITEESSRIECKMLLEGSFSSEERVELSFFLGRSGRMRRIMIPKNPKHIPARNQPIGLRFFSPPGKQIQTLTECKSEKRNR